MEHQCNEGKKTKKEMYPYINQQTGKSMYQFVFDAVLPAIEEEIGELTSE